MNRIADFLEAPDTGLEADADIEAIYELCLERGWSDGLPVIPPTVERVERMLAYCDRPWDEPLAVIPPRYGAATPLRLAANAVMAGCLPQYFPLVMLAIEAMAEEPFNLYGIQATTHPCAPLIIVNGPVARASTRHTCPRSARPAQSPGRSGIATAASCTRSRNCGGSEDLLRNRHAHQFRDIVETRDLPAFLEQGVALRCG